MDVGRQLFRFSIPGSIFLLWAVAGAVLIRLITGASLASTTAPLRENVAALTALVATIPVGFLLYQAYYVLYRPLLLNWPMVWYGRWIRIDRASQILCRFQENQIQALRDLFDVPLDITKPHEREAARPLRWLRLLKLSGDYLARHKSDTEARATYSNRWYDNWDVLRAIIDISEASEATRGIKREYVHLSDIYHALGATRTAIWAGWFTSVGVTAAATAHLGEPWGNWTIGVLAFAVPTTAILIVLHQTRRQTWISASKSLYYQLRWVFDNHPNLFEPVSGDPDTGAISRLRRRVGEAVLPE
jgi:hypothetical protein